MTMADSALGPVHREEKEVPCVTHIGIWESA
jgi:hypothetical protein